MNVSPSYTASYFPDLYVRLMSFFNKNYIEVSHVIFIKILILILQYIIIYKIVRLRQKLLLSHILSLFLLNTLVFLRIGEIRPDSICMLISSFVILIILKNNFSIYRILLVGVMLSFVFHLSSRYWLFSILTTCYILLIFLRDKRSLLLLNFVFSIIISSYVLYYIYELNIILQLISITTIPENQKDFDFLPRIKIILIIYFCLILFILIKITVSKLSKLLKITIILFLIIQPFLEFRYGTFYFEYSMLPVISLCFLYCFLEKKFILKDYLHISYICLPLLLVIALYSNVKYSKNVFEYNLNYRNLNVKSISSKELFDCLYSDYTRFNLIAYRQITDEIYYRFNDYNFLMKSFNSYPLNQNYNNLSSSNGFYSNYEKDVIKIKKSKEYIHFKDHKIVLYK